VNGPLGPGNDGRQIVREFEQRLRDLERIGDYIPEDNPLRGEIGEITEAMRRQMENADIASPEEIEALTRNIIDPLRSVELALSRELQLILGRENIRVAREDPIPARARQYVEEYYRRLGNDD
jgi:hypothetical protein